MRSNTDLKVTGGLLVLALAVGGAGGAFPSLAMLLQICALAGAGYFLTTRRDLRFQRLGYFAILVLGGILILPLLQLVPLPPGVWTQLPGRELPQQVDELLAFSWWRPLSLDIEGTIRSFLTLLPAAVVFLGSLLLSRSDRLRLLWLVLAFAIVSALLGIAQFTSGGSLTPYPSAHQGYPLGFFVNRNHSASLLLIGIVIAGALGGIQIRRGKIPAPWVVGSLSLMIILAIVAVATTSRMSLILLPVCFGAGLLLLFFRRSASRLAMASIAVVAAVASVIFASGGFERTFNRFSGLEDARFDYWADIQWALQYYGLAGTGFGTFVPVYKSAESLDAVVPQVINHAHNDYLEILLEGGIPAVVVMLAFVALITAALLRSLRAKSGPEQFEVTAAAFAGILILLASSIVDFPLRMPALSAVFALFCALLLPSPVRLPAEGEALSTSTGLAPAAPRSRIGIAAIVVGLAVIAALIVLTVQAGIFARQMSNNRSLAGPWLPGWSTQAHERLATQALLRDDLGTALSHAAQAYRLSPINAPAIRTMGLVYLSRGDLARGSRTMQTAAVLGWRDPLTQLWAIDAGIRSQEPDKAVQRAEALFRQSLLVTPATIQLLTSESATGLVSRLAHRLSTRPEWRRRFFQASGALPSATADTWVGLVKALDNSPAPVSLDEGNPSLKALIEAGRIEEAQRLWLLLNAKHGLVSNGDFEAVSEQSRTSYPAHWQVSRRNRGLVRVKASPLNPANRALHIRSTQGGTVLGQRLLLQPGSYRLTHRTHVTSQTGVAMRWELRCNDGGTRQVNDKVISSSASWSQGSVATFEVPAQNCPIQTLSLKRSGAAPIEDVWLDEVRLERTVR